MNYFFNQRDPQMFIFRIPGTMKITRLLKGYFDLPLVPTSMVIVTLSILGFSLKRKKKNYISFSLISVTLFQIITPNTTSGPLISVHLIFMYSNYNNNQCLWLSNFISGNRTKDLKSTCVIFTVMLLITIPDWYK